jgi:hypothetical protein
LFEGNALLMAECLWKNPLLANTTVTFKLLMEIFTIAAPSNEFVLIFEQVCYGIPLIRKSLESNGSTIHQG